jgi:membrane protein
MKSWLTMVKQAITDWSEDNAPRLAAALAYYTIFSMAPLLLIAISMAGLVFGAEAVQGRVVEQIDGMVGRTGAEAIEEMLKSARKPGAGVIATITGLVTLLLGATGAFNELRSGLNTVWEVPPPPKKGILGMVKDRVGSFMMILVIGFLLLVSLALSAGLAAVSDMFGFAGPLLQAVNVVVSLAVVTGLFAAIFKILPDTHVEWRDVWFGAGVTAVLFVIGKFAIGLYLGKSSVASAHGAAGSLVVLLVWVYYAAQILFFGAELTQVYAARNGSRIGAETKADKKAAASGQQPTSGPLPVPHPFPQAAREITARTTPVSAVWEQAAREQHAEIMGSRPAGAAFLVGTVLAVGLLANRKSR